MALGDNSIEYVANCMSASDHNVKKFYSDIEAAINKLHSDANYMTFVENTDIGKSIDQRIMKLKGIGKSTGSDVEKLVKRTQSFLDQQRILNKRASQSQTAAGAPKNEGTGGPGPSVSAINYAADPRFTASGGGH